MTPKVSIIIPTKDNSHICKLKNELKKQTFKDFELIVMNSDDPVSHKRNTGIIRAKADWVVFIDDDVQLHRKWLEELYANRDNGVVMGAVMPDHGFGHAGHAQTCNCIFPRHMFRPFDESFRKAAYEDKDWFYRMGGVKVIPSAVVHHMDQHRHSVKKSFTFGCESVRFARKWDDNMSCARGALHDIKAMLRDGAHLCGIAYGMVRYEIVRRG